MTNFIDFRHLRVLSIALKLLNIAIYLKKENKMIVIY